MKNANILNKFIHDDCNNIFPLIEDKSIDLILADLPYGTTENEWDIVLPMNDYIVIEDKTFTYDEYLLDSFKKTTKTLLELNTQWDLSHQKGLWHHYNRIIKDNGVILLYAQAPFDKILANSNLDMFRYEWIWEKPSATGFLNSKKMPLKAHENILVFYKQLPTYNPIKTKGHKKEVLKESAYKCIQSSNYGKQYKRADYCSDERYPRSVLKISTDKQQGQLHPTQKPIELNKYFIQTYTNVGDTVLDNTAGVASTPCACIPLGRNYIAIEKVKKFHAIGSERILKFKGEVGLFAENRTREVKYA